MLDDALFSLDDDQVDPEVSCKGSSPFSPVPDLMAELNIIFLDPTFTEWPSNRDESIKKAIGVLQLLLEEVVASAISVAEFVTKNRPPSKSVFGSSIPHSTYSGLLLSV